MPNAELQTSIVVYGTALLAPVGLFGERFQPGYDFTIAGEERIGNTKVVVVDAKPKPGTPPARNLYGKAWIDPATGDILKIEWSEGRVGNFDVFARRGERYKRTPRLSIRSEFSAEKNGIRFPSRLSIEETYAQGLRKSVHPLEDRCRLQGFQVLHRRVRGPRLMKIHRPLSSLALLLALGQDGVKPTFFGKKQV